MIFLNYYAAAVAVQEVVLEKGNFFKLLLSYIFYRRKVIFMFIAYQLIYCIVIILYQLHNVDKLLYGVYISVFISICYGIWDYVKYFKKIKKTEEALVNLENVLELMPKAYDGIEKQYQNIIISIYDEMQQLLFKINQKEAEMKDYYTLWAHQVKTPLAAMRLILQNENSDSGKYSLQEELYKIEQYVEMALHYLRLESMSSDLILKEYQLRDIVNQAVKRNAVMFINSKISVKIKEFSHIVITDEKWLLFVIEQLITNALKYTHKGSITISLEYYRNKHWLVIEDTGIGIRGEDLPRIFEKGFTGYNGRLGKKSTGIGLYLCKQILDKLSHNIEVFSELGKGTRVCIDVSTREFF